jgi:integrase
MQTGYKKSISEEEIKLLDSFFAAKCKDKSIIMAYLLMRFNALPIHEAVSIKPENIQDDMIRMIRSKTKRMYEVPLHPKVRLWYNAYTLVFKAQIEDCGYVCFSYNHPSKHIQESTIRNYFKTFRQTFGFDTPYYIKKHGGNNNLPQPLYRISPHTLRHYAATQAAKLGLLVAKDLLCHQKLETTVKYYIDSTSKEDKIKALELL